MSNKKQVVINTGPLIALVAALNDLKALQVVFDAVFVPQEVCNEISFPGEIGFAVKEFKQATWLIKYNQHLEITPFLKNSLDIGEASVIQLAMNKNI